MQCKEERGSIKAERQKLDIWHIPLCTLSALYNSQVFACVSPNCMIYRRHLSQVVYFLQWLSTSYSGPPQMFVKEIHFLNRKKEECGEESGAPDSCLPALTAATQSLGPEGLGAESSESLGGE